MLMIIISVMIQDTIDAETIVHFQKGALYFFTVNLSPNVQ